MTSSLKASNSVSSHSSSAKIPCVQKNTRPTRHTQNCVDKVGIDIFKKAMNFLDLDNLISCFHVNRQFRNVTNDDRIWLNLAKIFYDIDSELIKKHPLQLNG